MQVVAVNDQIAIKCDRTYPLIFMRHKRAKRHGQMMVVDKFLSLEIEFGHYRPLPTLAVLP